MDTGLPLVAHRLRQAIRAGGCRRTVGLQLDHHVELVMDVERIARYLRPLLYPGHAGDRLAGRALIRHGDTDTDTRGSDEGPCRSAALWIRNRIVATGATKCGHGGALGPDTNVGGVADAIAISGYLHQLADTLHLIQTSAADLRR